jgi:hypothetical protein
MKAVENYPRQQGESDRDYADRLIIELHLTAPALALAALSEEFGVSKSRAAAMVQRLVQADPVARGAYELRQQRRAWLDYWTQGRPRGPREETQRVPARFRLAKKPWARCRHCGGATHSVRFTGRGKDGPVRYHVCPKAGGWSRTALGGAPMPHVVRDKDGRPAGLRHSVWADPSGKLGPYGLNERLRTGHTRARAA